MSYMNTTELKPDDNTGLENYKFFTPYEKSIYVYHYTTLDGFSKVWLCCTEGWELKDDGKWHEPISCGWKPDRIADTVEDIFNFYRLKT